MARESKTKKRERIVSVLDVLKTEFPDAHCELVHRNPYELLSATILSAQCTDKRVNMVTPALFEKYPSPAALATGTQEDVEVLVKTTGFFRNKAKSLLGMARAVMTEHGGVIPMQLDALVKLPGVGRKTANVLLGEYDTPVGVVVDTHVQRISRLLKITTKKDAVQIERDLIDLVPRVDWALFAHLMIWHGRKTCIARRPQCGHCPLVPFCPSAQLS